MRTILFKRIFIWGNVILPLALLITCSSPDVKATPKVSVNVTPEVNARAIPKIIDTMTVMIHFDFDQTTLTPADLAELKKAVSFVKKYPINKIQIDGYSDITGDENYNIGLSERRANVTKDYLIEEAGIRISYITTVGHGTMDPIGDRKTETGRAMNRRAVISILSE